MKRSSRIPKIGSIFTFFAVVSVGCAPSNRVTPGAPQLVNFVVVTPEGAGADLETEAGAPIPVPPLSFMFAHFDRILDPTPLEDVDPDGGAITPKAGVAVVEWSGGAIPATTLYIPNGDVKWTLIPALFGLPFGIGPSITVTPTEGLPSGAMVRVTLDPNKVRSRDQRNGFVPATGVASPLMFETDLLAVTITVPVFVPPDAGVAGHAGAPDVGTPDVGTPDAGTPDAGTPDGGTPDAGTPDTGMPVTPDASTADASADGGVVDGGGPMGPPPPVATDYVVKVSFNNRTPASNEAAFQVALSIGGVPVIGIVPVITQDPENSAEWTVAPPATGWPPGAVVTVTVNTTATDNFQVALASATSATFTVMQ